MRDKILMADLRGQYNRIKQEIDDSIQSVVQSGKYINGPDVSFFAEELADWLGVKHVIPCANGTDALQLSIMALQLETSDEVLLPAYTYVATAEVVSLLGLKPVFVDVNPDTFTIDIRDLVRKISTKSKLIIPVHLFGQCAEMGKIFAVAKKYNLKIVEDTAQAIGAEHFFTDGRSKIAGTMGDFGITSFFPSKNLGCFGDGGALFTNNDELASCARIMANHGQNKKYYHDLVGCNSRLDTLQAAILRVKLRYLPEYTAARRSVAGFYYENLKNTPDIQLPVQSGYTSHVFNQYTIKLNVNSSINTENFRDCLREELKKMGVPSMVYYPLPVHLQKAYRSLEYPPGSLPVSEALSKSVLSLPIHTEMREEELNYIVEAFKKALTLAGKQYQLPVSSGN